MADEESTKQLIADAEKLAGKRDSGGKPPRTKQIISESEKLIGRDTSGGSSGLVWALVLVAVGVGAALYFLKS